MKSILLFFLVLCSTKGFSQTEIFDYKVIREDCDEFIAIRSFTQQNQKYKLVVHKESMRTTVVHEQSLNCQSGLMNLKDNSAFERNLMRQTDAPYLLANHGLKSWQNSGLGQVVSVDLCPSTNAFDRALFEKLIAEVTLKPIPISIAITSLWMNRFGSDLAWLKQQARNGQLQITWVNHSQTHPYYPGVSLDRNFLLASGVDFDREVLGNEINMLQHGLIPSVFFRFPGLISNEAQIKKLRDYSLIPLGSTAWLAKGEKVDLRSLILVHGNGNESQGIYKMLGLIRQKIIFPRSLESYSIFGQ